MSKDYKEWILQAEYDMGTADVMFNTGRYIYAVFMCHLAIEKALKGIFLLKLGEIPPKTHNLIFLLNSMGVKPNEETGIFIAKLNETSITVRYPDDLMVLQKDYTKEVTADIIDIIGNKIR